jgi:hypothetical protein
MTIEKTFERLITDEWVELPKSYKEKYKSYRSKAVTGNGIVGLGKKIEMLEKAGYKVLVEKNKVLKDK